MTFNEAKQTEAAQWEAEHDPYAPKPILIAAVLEGKPLPTEPLAFE